MPGLHAPTWPGAPGSTVGPRIYHDGSLQWGWRAKHHCKVEKAKGYVKAQVGKATNDPDLEAEGTVQRGAGAVQEGIGKARRKVGEAVKKVGDAIKD
jgi:uncharacterized protein YjbJ (UPF0337 family)